MATNDISLNVVAIAATQTALQPVVNASAGSAGTTAKQPQTQSQSSGNGSSSGGSSSAAQPSNSQVKEQVDNALKNTGVKAEIEMEQGLGMIMRLVTADTGQVLVQLPPQAVLDMVAQIDSEQDQEVSERFGGPNYNGTHIDQVA
jgi:uncharacterized FlaG/YvyC family protein